MDLIRTEETKKNLPILSLNHIFHFTFHFSSLFHFFYSLFFFLSVFSFFFFPLIYSNSLDNSSYLKYKREKIKQSNTIASFCFIYSIP